MLWDEAQKEERDRKPHGVECEEVGGLRNPEEHEASFYLTGWDVSDVPSEAQVVCLNKDTVGANRQKLTRTPSSIQTSCFVVRTNSDHLPWRQTSPSH